jgi:inactivated superfamily I helicase
MSNAWNIEKKKIVLLNKSQIEKILYETAVNANVEYGVKSKEAKAVNLALDWVSKFIKDGKAEAILTISEEEHDSFIRYEE